VLPLALEPRLAKWSAYAELAGYVAAITLRAIELQDLEKRIARFEETMSQMSIVRCCRAAASAHHVQRIAQQCNVFHARGRVMGCTR
jgi:hypothetical protein